jgi:hypothetical protein
MSNGLTRLLFEDLSLLLLAELAGLAVILGVHRTRMTPYTRRLVWIFLAVCAGLIALQYTVVTDREAIQATVEAMARDVEQGNVQALGDKFDEAITFERIEGKQAVLREAYRTLQRYDINNARVSGFDIKLDGNRAQVHFQAVAEVRGGPATIGRTPTVWDLVMVRDEGDWRVLGGQIHAWAGSPGPLNPTPPI